jgi:hypothetical protein
VGKSGGIWFALEMIKSLNAVTPVAVSMLVYIDLASAVKRAGPSGTVKFFKSSSKVSEFFM